MRQFNAFMNNAIFRSLPTTQLRAWFLRRLGASVGTNARIHALDFLNAEDGFDRLSIGSNCYIGPGVMIDLAGEVCICDGAVISARSMLLSHDDPGQSHSAPLCRHFPARKERTVIGADSWLGAGSLVLAGTKLGEQCVLAAGSVARGDLLVPGVYAGAPASLKRRLE